MNYSTIVAAARSRSDSRFIDFVELTKPRISVLVLFSVAAAAFASGENSVSLFTILHVVLATGFVAASASIANQVIEASSDALMARTSNRPIPSGRIGLAEAIFLSVATVVIGESYLAWTSGPLAAGLGAVTWILYVLVYTPLKKYSSLNTIVGAIPGAMPVLIGWAATKSPINSTVVTMFVLLVLWQLPHFMAIAWLYRRDYRCGGFRMLTVTEPSGLFAGRLAAVIAAVIIPISVMPSGTLLNPLYSVPAVLLGLGQLGLAVEFWKTRDDRSARRLLRASIIYLPAILLMLALLPQMK